VRGDVPEGLGAATMFAVVFGVIVERGLLRAACIDLFEIPQGRVDGLLA